MDNDSTRRRIYQILKRATILESGRKMLPFSRATVMNMNLGCGNQSGSVPSKRHRSLSGQICPLAHVPRFTSHADEDSAPKGDIPPPKTLPVTNLFFFLPYLLPALLANLIPYSKIFLQVLCSYGNERFIAAHITV